MIGCESISKHHLTAYRTAGFTVAALRDLDRQRAVERRDAFYPEADVEDSTETLLRRTDIDVIGLPLHPEPCAP